MLYKIRFDTDHGYDYGYNNEYNIGRQKWSVWFIENHIGRIGFCEIHPTNQYKQNTYYLFGHDDQYCKEL